MTPRTLLDVRSCATARPKAVRLGKGVKVVDESLNRDEVLRHFGYNPQEAAPSLGLWKNDGTAISRLQCLPEVIRLYGEETQKIRIVFDYDPDFSKALLQVWGLAPTTLFLLQDNRPVE